MGLITKLYNSDSDYFEYGTLSINDTDIVVESSFNLSQFKAFSHLKLKPNSLASFVNGTDILFEFLSNNSNNISSNLQFESMDSDSDPLVSLFNVRDILISILMLTVIFAFLAFFLARKMKLKVNKGILSEIYRY